MQRLSRSLHVVKGPFQRHMSVTGIIVDDPAGCVWRTTDAEVLYTHPSSQAELG